MASSYSYAGFDFNIFFVGHGGKDSILVNQNGRLYATVFQQWFDEIQIHIPGKRNVVIDSPYSGNLIPSLSNHPFILIEKGNDIYNECSG